MSEAKEKVQKMLHQIPDRASFEDIQYIKLSNSLKTIERYKLLGKKMYKYAIEIFYSEEDEGYIVVVPELPGCSAFGETEEAALKEVMTAMELWLETAEKEGREIPKPAGKELLKAVVDEKTVFPF